MTGASRFDGANVLVVSPIAGGSLPIAGHVTDALRELGANAVLLDFSWLSPPSALGEAAASPEARAALVAYTSALVRREAERRRPDLCFVLAQAPIDEPTVARLRERGVPTAFWFVENYRLTRYWSHVAPLYDWFFTVQRSGLHDALKAAGCNNYAWLPLAANQRRHRPRRIGDKLRRRYGSDVSFAGYGYFNRREMLAGIADFDLKVWGPGFEGSAFEAAVQNDGASFDEDDFARIAASALIHVNLHSAAHVSGVDPDGDYLNPRTFELAALGGFQLCDRRADMSSFFDVPSEIVTFDDLSSLRAKIRYFLKHDDERRAIVSRARRRVLKEHTYRHRMEEVLTRTLVRSPAETCRAPILEGFPRLSGRELNSFADASALAREWAAESRASDDELLLRLALGRKLDP